MRGTHGLASACGTDSVFESLGFVSVKRFGILFTVWIVVIYLTLEISRPVIVCNRNGTRRGGRKKEFQCLCWIRAWNIEG